ncbi:MAG: type II toxin-antitoxin system PemK/MazF family toxin [Flavobacteriales bacterium]|nr:type II toxin-antitoxin system PemK/MazF family toxin [Flavobacteriales bacterium]
MRKGDIVLVPFPFTDLTGTKNRPALVLARSDRDVMLAFISTRLHALTASDVVLEPSLGNGLKKESLLRLTKLVTLDARLVLGRIGSLSAEELARCDERLAAVLGLGAR